MAEESAQEPFWKNAALQNTLLIGGILLLGYVALGPSDMAGFDVHERGEGDAVVVLLHGYGASGDDLVPVAEELVSGVEGLRVVAVEAPVNVGMGGRAWYLQADQRAAVVTRLAELVDELGPREQVIVAGFSQGSEIAGLVAQARPGMAGVGFCSGGAFPPAAPASRVFISHGRADSVLPFSASEVSAASYDDSAEVTFFAFAGGHELRPAVAAFKSWVRESLGL